MTKDGVKIQVYSESDGWTIQVVDTANNSLIGKWYWNHNDSGAGVGGEKQFALALQSLGYDIYVEDVY